MKHLKVTMNRRSLLEDGYPRHDWCEIDGDHVVRRIQGWDNEKLIKQSLENADEWRERKGLRESVPDLSWNKPEENVLVEEISSEAFEEMWAKAELVGEGWG